MAHLDDNAIARSLFIVHWIGGVAFVTLAAPQPARAGRDGWACSSRSRRDAALRSLRHEVVEFGALPKAHLERRQ